MTLNKYFAQKLVKENNADEFAIQEAIRFLKSIPEKREGFDSISESKDKEVKGLLANLRVHLANIQRNKDADIKMAQAENLQALLGVFATK